MAGFNEETIKVSHPNKEIFVGAFQNGLKVDHFIESLAQKPAASMDEVMNMEECYIKGEEINMEKKSQNAKERAQNRSGSSGRERAFEAHAQRQT